MHKIFRSLLQVIFVLAALIFACSPNEEQPEKAAVLEVRPEPAHGDALLEGSIGDATNLLPMLSSDTASHGIANLVFNGLLKYDKNIELTGDLAERWDVSEDGAQITFHLRKGVTWHDGTPFTAGDALFTYELMVDPKTPTAYANDFLQVEKAEVPDDYTFRVTYRRPFAPGLPSWGMGIVPAHLLKGEDITRTPLAREPVGTGPYVFQRWIQGQELLLRANPDYFEGEPYITEHKVRIIPDLATMFLELRAGGVDLMGLTPLQFKRQTVDQDFQSRFNRYTYLASNYTYMGFNLLDPKFQDKRVRQAIAHAINKEQIIEGVLLGLGEPASGPYKPGSWVHNPDVKQYPHDPERARLLLAEAGWSGGHADGILRKEGQPFRFTILTNQGNETRQKTGVIIQSNLKQIGLDVQLRSIEWAAFLKEFVDKKNFEALILGWTIPPDPDLFDVWHSSKNRPGELNFISYRNEEVDRLIEQGRYTFDEDLRRQSYHRIQEILAEDQPYVFLYVPQALVAVSSRVHGIEPAPIGLGHNRVKWFVPKNQQKYRISP